MYEYYDETPNDTCVEAKMDVSGGNIINHLVDMYGGPQQIVKSVTEIIQLAKPKNKIIDRTIRIIPQVLMAYDLGKKVYRYYDDKRISPSQKKRMKIHTLFGTHEGLYPQSVYNHSYGDTFNDNVITWLLDSDSEFSGFSVGRIYDDKTVDEISSIGDAKKKAGMTFSFDGEICFYLSFRVLEYNGDYTYTASDLYCNKGDDAKIVRFLTQVGVEYFKSLDIENNVLYFKYNIQIKPRCENPHYNFYTLDYEKLKSDIRASLASKTRRGYLLAGVPGTGKTSVLQQLESDIKDYPVLYLTPKNLDSEEAIIRVFSFIVGLRECIVMIEDFDSFELESKSNKIAFLLGCLDATKVEHNAVFIATINNASKITKSVVRPGRFDEIIEVKPPKANKEIYEVMQKQYSIKTNEELVTRYEDINWLTYLRLKMHNLTHADYSEVVQKILLNGGVINNKTLMSSLKDILNSKKTIKKFKNETD